MPDTKQEREVINEDSKQGMEKWNGRIDDGSVLFQNMIFVSLVSGQQGYDAVVRHEDQTTCKLSRGYFGNDDKEHEPCKDGMHVFLGCGYGQSLDLYI
jgi:hypothetical protein